LLSRIYQMFFCLVVPFHLLVKVYPFGGPKAAGFAEC